jgi:hypothetical protein
MLDLHHGIDQGRSFFVIILEFLYNIPSLDTKCLAFSQPTCFNRRYHLLYANMFDYRDSSMSLTDALLDY